jgi:hypothetical protein
VIERALRGQNLVLSTTRGTLTIWPAPPGVLRTTFAGVMDSELMDALLVLGEEILGEHSGLHVFHDWSGMTGYDSQARIAITNWGLARLKQMRSVHVLHGSKLVAMGVAVANVALGGIVNVHQNRGSFDRAFATHGRAHVTPTL